MFRRRGLSRIRSAMRNSRTVRMFLRDEAGHFSSDFVSFVPTSVNGRGDAAVISGRAGSRSVSVNASTINWQSVQLLG